MESSQMKELVLMRAETFIHVGAGTGQGLIDLPIMRESHTGWPVIYGSAMKGALRAKAETNPALKENIATIFGKTDGAGNLLVGDARLLWLPVRSMNTHTVWLTCPAILQRLELDLQRLGKNTGQFAKDLSNVTMENCLLHKNLETRAGSALFIEEHSFTPEEICEGKIEKLITLFGTTEPCINELIKDRLVIVHDDVFAHFSQVATPVIPHISIEQKTKTTKDGSLRYEESLPPETMFYMTLLGVQRGGKSIDELDTLLADFKTNCYLQVGANETTGMGWFKLSLAKGSDHGSQ